MELSRIAKRVGRLSPLRMYAIQEAGERWRAANPGKPYSNFFFGDIPVPWKNSRVFDDAVDGMRKIPGGYRRPRGESEVLKVVADDFRATHGTEVDPERQVVLVNGVIEALRLSAEAVINPGEQAVIPAPHYFLYPDDAVMADGTPIIVQTSEANDFKITPSELRFALTPQTKVFFFNSPLNPVGSIYSQAEMRALAQALRERPETVIFCDEVYERIYLDGERPVSLWEVAPDLRDRMLIMSSLAKSTGWSEKRAGWVIGPEDLISAVRRTKLMSSWANTNDSQAAILAALSDRERFNAEVEEVRTKLREGRNYMLDRLRQMRFVVPNAPGGVFVFPKVPDNLNLTRPEIPGVVVPPDIELTYSERFAYHALSYGVAIVPGVDLGSADHFRLPFCMDRAEIEQGLDKLQMALEAA